MELNTKRDIVRKLSEAYWKAQKKEKGNILAELIRLTGYHRVYARRVLRDPPKEAKQSRNKPSSYAPVLLELRKLWKTSNYCCGQLLVAAIPALIPVLKRTGDLTLTQEQENLLLRISSATIDRLLKPERKKLGVKGRSGTKPGALLKHQIPVKTFTPWDEQMPGFLEIDCVAHCGESLWGEYINTLDCVDLATCWSEKQALLGKGERRTIEAFLKVEKRYVFPILGIDSDNGNEFINWHFLRLAKEKHITFTRSRPFKKNDQAHIEQKNYSTVRKIIGYKRLTTETQLSQINELYSLLSDYQNFFIPTKKLEKRICIGAKHKRVYAKPTTPYQRVLAHSKIAEEIKEKLREKYQTLNPVTLLESINQLVDLVNKG
jgi:hypothetical protein